jgi:hypothetical protein
MLSLFFLRKKKSCCKNSLQKGALTYKTFRGCETHSKANSLLGLHNIFSTTYNWERANNIDKCAQDQVLINISNVKMIVCYWLVIIIDLGGCI